MNVESEGDSSTHFHFALRSKVRFDQPAFIRNTMNPSPHCSLALGSYVEVFVTFLFLHFRNAIQRP
jgi:hypothetical protein